MTIASSVSGIINGIGQTISVRYVTAGAFNTTTLSTTNTTSDVSVIAHVKEKYSAVNTMAGLVHSYTKEIRIAASDLAIDPTVYDKIIIGSKQYNIFNVNILYEHDTKALYIIGVQS